MPQSLNVIALISGGKDSLFSLLHCIQNGHKVVALANLYPKPQTKIQEDTALVRDQASDNTYEDDDTNSFMYQTVGYSVIPLYAEALELPLYRREISGSAQQTGRYYAPDSTRHESLDETEDLIPLLQQVLTSHPEANAVSSGAILSTYQRTRIESVATRLNLIPLAYLWQYPVLPPPIERPDSLTGLLDDMNAAGCDSRMIKIASGGIKESFLGKNVTSLVVKQHIVNSMASFFPDHELWLRGAIVGEGGEYETLSINGPSRVWKRKIDFREQEYTTFTGEGGTSYLRFGKMELVNQDDTTHEDGKLVRTPPDLDAQFQAVTLAMNSDSTLQLKQHDSSSAMIDSHIEPLHFKCTHNLTSRHLTISNLTTSTISPIEDVSLQMSSICTRLHVLLNDISQHIGMRQLSTSNIVSTTLLLSNMSDFAQINAIYASIFSKGQPNPPARVTISCSLPPNIKVSLSVVLELGSRDDRRGLHVQSRSYWAPANIGPYSQAISETIDSVSGTNSSLHDAALPEIVHVAGQIPLVPQSMEVLNGPFLNQAILSLQHLWRVGQERGIDLWPWGVAFLEEQGTNYTQHISVAEQVWKRSHHLPTRRASDASDEEEDILDAWDLQHNHYAGFQSNKVRTTLGEHLHTLPNTEVFVSSSVSTIIPPFIAAEVITLPRNAPIEWWSLGLANLPKRYSAKPRVQVDSFQHGWGTATMMTILPVHDLDEIESSNPSRRSVHLITILIGHIPPPTTVAGNPTLPSLMQMIEQMIYSPSSPSENHQTEEDISEKTIIQGTAFVSYETGWSVLDSLAATDEPLPVTIIPCRRIWASNSMSRPSASPSRKPEEDPNVADLNISDDERQDRRIDQIRLALTLRVDITATDDIR